jgi:hypothetical protein
VADVSSNHTRAILEIDTTNRMLHVFMAAPCCSGGKIYHKQSSLDSISFPPGLGTEFIYHATDTCINNPTSTKQNLTSTTNLVVVAGAGCGANFYHHNFMDLP